MDETRKELCEQMLADISVIKYVPFDSETIGNPALDLGDVLRFSGNVIKLNKACQRNPAINQPYIVMI